jgi:hypothetical protein
MGNKTYIFSPNQEDPEQRFGRFFSNRSIYFFGLFVSLFHR